MGYDISATTNTNEYMRCTPYAHRTFAPWFAKEFQTLFNKICDRTVVTQDRCYVVHQLAKQCILLEGNYAECGVYKGGTSFLIADAIAGSGKRLDLFDTFRGMPLGAEEDSSDYSAGDFGDTSLRNVKTYLDTFPFIRFFQGLMLETFGEVSDETYCFVHVDVDLYESVRECCEFFYHRLSTGGVMIFDDYGFEMLRDAAKRAVDDFFSDKPEILLSLHTGQCIVTKLPQSTQQK
jgi:O-methyltransferase